MAGDIQALRGMNDIFSPAIEYWQYIENTIRDLMASYGYHEIRFPVLEATSLYKRSLGDTTDIVEKEMYTFADRNGESLTLRPEGTAGCVRAAIQHSLLHNLPQRLWYTGPMYRHERPQQGRYRQFYQFGVEAFGLTTPATDAEIISIAAQLWQRLGISEGLTLQINSLGTPEIRRQYREELIRYLTPLYDQLDADSQRRLHHNPMRILDSKNPETRALVANAPRLLDRLDAESQQHFDEVIKTLEALQIPYVINPNIVRGLDYYMHTVFEWITDRLGAQDAVCAGGRYDGLVEQLGGKPTPAVGFALGMERLIALLSTVKAAPENKVHAYVIAEKEYLTQAQQLAYRLRQEVSGLRLIVDNSGASLKSQFKKADKSAAEYALVLGAHEINEGFVSVKMLREEASQLKLTNEELLNFIKGKTSW